MKRKLTAATVEKIKPPTSGRLEIFDATLPGFALRITCSGRKSWVCFYRHGGRLRRMTLGSYPALNLQKARAAAGEAMREAAKGNDPAAEKAAKKTAQADTVAAVVEEFLDRHASKTRSAAETRRIFNVNVLPKWRNRRIESITRRDVVELLDGIADERGPYMANRTLAAVRKLMNWAAARDIIPASPASKVPAPGKETKRDRVLSDDEIKELWAAFESMSYPLGRMLQMLLITAQRRTEVASMRWQDLDADVWVIPREMTKSDRAHSVPLSPLAVSILEQIPRIGDYVFTSQGDKPVSGYGAAKNRAAKLSGIEDWRIHDLRRSAASGMARLNIPPHVLSKILNHASDGMGVTGIYNRFGYEDEKRHALELWAKHLENLISGEGTGNVVELRP